MLLILGKRCFSVGGVKKVEHMQMAEAAEQEMRELSELLSDEFFNDEFYPSVDRCDAELNEREANALWDLLELKPDVRVLDAPSGYGRLSRLLALKGARVVGVDKASALVAIAERNREGLDEGRLRYAVHDLRRTFEERTFDAALNVGTSLGFGSETDDAAILCSIAAAVKVGGLVAIESVHRDAIAAVVSKSRRNATTLENGTSVVENFDFDVVTGIATTRLSWHTGQQAVTKSLSVRVYTVTELIQMAIAAGLQFHSAYARASTIPFRGSGAEFGGCVTLVCRAQPF